MLMFLWVTVRGSSEARRALSMFRAYGLWRSCVTAPTLHLRRRAHRLDKHACCSRPHARPGRTHRVSSAWVLTVCRTRRTRELTRRVGW